MKRAFFSFIVLVMLSACAQNTSHGPKDRESELEFTASMLRFKDNISVEKVGQGRGVSAIGQTFYTIDAQQKKIVERDSNQNIVRQSDPLALVNPVFIKTVGDMIYVLDRGFNQIITFDYQFNQKNQYALKISDTATEYLDFEVLGTDIFYTASATLEQESVIFKLDTITQETTTIGEKFRGYLAVFQQTLYAVSTLEYFEDGQFAGFRSGNNYFYEVKDHQLVKKFDFWTGYAPTDFIVLDHTVYVFSGATNSLDEFSLVDGAYVQSIGKIDDDSAIFINLAQMQTDFYVSYPKTNTLWRMH